MGQGVAAGPPAAATYRPTSGPEAGWLENQRSREPGLGEQLGRLANDLASGIKQVLQISPKDRDGDRADSSQPPLLGPGTTGSYPQLAAPAGNSTAADDEALARALQEQFDLEEERQRQQQLQPPATTPVTASGANSRRPASIPDGAPNGSRGSLFSASPPAPPMQPQVYPVPAGPGACAGCGQPLMGLTSFFGGGGRYVTALGRSWHPSCFCCAACRQPLATGSGVQFSIGSQDGLPYHAQCHKQRFHPRCRVCGGFVPTQGNNQVVWSETPFWKDKFCPRHNEDGTKRCTGCTRPQPHGEQWVDLDDGRAVCLECLDTLVADTADCQPLWDAVLRFYVDMGMPLPHRPPMHLVESGALNLAERSETYGQGRQGPVFHTRGLCITEEHATFQTVTRVRRTGGEGRGGGGLLGGVLPGGYSLEPHTVQLGPARAEVTAILVLFGLPWLLTGSILAHEVMHAWLRLSGYPRLPQKVEEGMCQLMALLWLEKQHPKEGSYEERLASFLANQIRTDPSEVYGEGFRDALEAFQRFGLQTLLAHLRQAGRLPS
ncbi:hypothetical protein N2152v2_006028 [Parachlorella kessleri]